MRSDSAGTCNDSDKSLCARSDYLWLVQRKFLTHSDSCWRAFRRAWQTGGSTRRRSGPSGCVVIATDAPQPLDGNGTTMVLPRDGASG
jgi:S-formylglutathione hydrolase FrmB